MGRDPHQGNITWDSSQRLSYAGSVEAPPLDRPQEGLTVGANKGARMIVLSGTAPTFSRRDFQLI